MKQFFLVALSASLTTASLAQTAPDYGSANNKQPDLLGGGTLHVGVNANVGYGGFVGLTGRVVPRLQYFLKDGWSVALEGRYSTDRNQYRYAGAGLSTRYYFVRDRRLALFGQAGATYGQSRYRTYRPDSGVDPILPQRWVVTERTSRAWQATAGLGVHYRVSNRWSLEGVMERNLTNNLGAFRSYSRWQGSVGVNFRLKK